MECDGVVCSHKYLLVIATFNFIVICLFFMMMYNIIIIQLVIVPTGYKVHGY